MTLISILQPYLAVTAIWMAKKTRRQRNGIAGLNSTLSRCHQANARQAQQCAQVVTGKLFSAQGRSRKRHEDAIGTRQNALLPAVVCARPIVSQTVRAKHKCAHTKPDDKVASLKCAMMRLWKMANITSEAGRKRT